MCVGGSSAPVAHPPPLDLLRGHDDDVRVLLIHHLPEVDDRVLQAPLGGDENLACVHEAPLIVQTLEGSGNDALD